MATMAEERTHFAAWCISSSPLVLGFDLRNQTKLDRVWDIITNEAAINVSHAWVDLPPIVANAVDATSIASAASAASFPSKLASTGGLLSSWRAMNIPTIVADNAHGYNTAPSCDATPPVDGYTHVNAALTSNHALHQGNYTLAAAKAWCKADPLCSGFTFETNKTRRRTGAEILADDILAVYFKDTNVLNEDAAWQVGARHINMHSIQIECSFECC
jgi:hypothetical protein